MFQKAIVSVSGLFAVLLLVSGCAKTGFSKEAIQGNWKFTRLEAIDSTVEQAEIDAVSNSLKALTVRITDSKFSFVGQDGTAVETDTFTDDGQFTSGLDGFAIESGDESELVLQVDDDGTPTAKLFYSR